MRATFSLIPTLASLLLGACAGPVGARQSPDVRPYMLLDIGESMHADSRMEIADLGAAGAFDFETAIEGRWGLAAGVEFDVFENVDARVGWIVRRLRALDIEGLAFEPMTQVEAMGALLWEPMGRETTFGGWVPHLELRLGLVPHTRIPTIFGPGTADIPLKVDASSYWKWGLGAGLSRPMGSGLRFELGAIYEEAFDPAEADSVLVIGPNFQVPTHSEFSPRGWIFTGGFIWSL